MPLRDTAKLNKVIYDRLNSSSALIAKIGAGRVKHSSPLNISEYPCVTYQLFSDQDDPFGEDRSAGIATSLFDIQIFSNSTSSKEADEIEDIIYALFHDVSFASDGVIVYSCVRQGKTPIYEEEIKVHRILTTYRITNSYKV
jgi:hypothetical protein